MNTKLLRKVQKEILAHPRQFKMDWWFGPEDSTGKPASGCGTAACIAGWAIVLGNNYKKVSEAVEVLRGGCGTTSEKATKLLGLESQRGANKLFGTADWPIEFRERWNHALDAAYDVPVEKRAKYAKECAQIASDRIDHFIKTKGEE